MFAREASYFLLSSTVMHVLDTMELIQIHGGLSIILTLKILLSGKKSIIIIPIRQIIQLLTKDSNAFTISNLTIKLAGRYFSGLISGH